MPAHTWVWIETCSFILSTTNWNVRWIWPITRNFIACWTLTRRWTNTRLWLRFWANTHLSMLTTSNYLLEIERVRNWILISKSLRGSKCQDFLRWCCCCFEEQKKRKRWEKSKRQFFNFNSRYLSVHNVQNFFSSLSESLAPHTNFCHSLLLLKMLFFRE